MLRWFGHVLRLPPIRIVKQVLSEFPGGGGGGTTPWVVQKGETRLVTMGSLRQIAENRAMWKSLVASLTPRP
ncbi:UNVERIFIED_CONTAM: hypothetical protein PYX00_000849 [Menopon gallinae]|uniref:Uncharacterized protein n=1 Tax=Menopon gallinae TaxID=328185 RepID=A0AAW2IA58_9NEOP